jgi:hypothetical protein
VLLGLYILTMTGYILLHSFIGDSREISLGKRAMRAVEVTMRPPRSSASRRSSHVFSLAHSA